MTDKNLRRLKFCHKSKDLKRNQNLKFMIDRILVMNYLVKIKIFFIKNWLISFYIIFNTFLIKVNLSYSMLINIQIESVNQLIFALKMNQRCYFHKTRPILHFCSLSNFLSLSRVMHTPSLPIVSLNSWTITPR